MTAGWLFVMAGAGFFLAQPLHADKIVLKDGTVEESDRVWQTEGYVHFILRGTRSVEIRYAKALVERIERKGHPREQLLQRKEPKPEAAVEVPPAPKSQEITTQQLNETDRRLVKKLQGIAFYDPRRPERYWADAEAHYTTLEDAVRELARQYGQSAQWVTQHIGEENDLALIHENLLLGGGKEDKTNPHDTGSSVAALKSVPQVVEKSEEAPVAVNMWSATPVVPTTGGVQFYDPRRPEKYWVSPEQRFRSLNEALAALAAIYKKPVDWVEAHMGDSNELADIHLSLENSLAPKSGEK